jgi:hypothetical protein
MRTTPSERILKASTGAATLKTMRAALRNRPIAYNLICSNPNV